MKIYINISNYYYEMNNGRQSGTFQSEEDTFSRIAQGISKNCHEMLLSTKLLQTEPQVKNMNINYYDIYYTVVKNRDDKKIVVDKYEKNETDFIKFNDIITPNHYMGRKIIKELLR